jgi:hypothetical protein
MLERVRVVRLRGGGSWGTKIGRLDLAERGGDACHAGTMTCTAASAWPRVSRMAAHPMVTMRPPGPAASDRGQPSPTGHGTSMSRNGQQWQYAR